MPDIKEIEARLKSIEDRFKEIDKKLEEKVQPAKTMQEEEPVIIEGSDRLKSLDDMRERIQELEDLLLLIELENTKLRESVAAGTGAEIVPAVTPDINERLSWLEEQVLSAREPAPKDEERIHSLEEKIESLEERISAKSEASATDIDAMLEKYEKRIQDLEERLRRIEKAPKIVTRVEKITATPEKESKLLEEVQIILKK